MQFLRLQNRPDSGSSNADSSKKRKGAPQKTVHDPSNLKEGDRVELELFHSTHLLQITRTYQHQGTLGWFMDGIIVSTGEELYEFACLFYADESRVHSKAASSTDIDRSALKSEHTSVPKSLLLKSRASQRLRLVPLAHLLLHLSKTRTRTLKGEEHDRHP